MKDYFHFLLVFAVILTSFSLSGQSKERAVAILETAGSYYLRSNYETTLSYVLKTRGGRVVDQYNGFAVKRDKQSYSIIGPVEYIQDSGYFLKINNEEKAMIFSKGSQDFTVQAGLWAEIVEAYEKVKVEEGAEHYRITMRSGAISQNPYESIELLISKKDHRFLKQVMVLSGSGDFSAQGEPLMLEITFKETDNLLKKGDAHKFLIKSYLGNLSKAYPIGEYKDYEFIDTTKI